MSQHVTLPGTVQPAANGLKGFDADTVITASTAAEFASSGYAFCVRYLSRGNGQQSGDLSYNEALDILNGGLALMAVQHVAPSGWEPSASLGTEYGTYAADNALSIGLPASMNIWCDLEGVAEGVAAQDVIDYCNAWYDAAEKAGYVPGLYVGASCILDGQQLYDLKFQHYWKSLSNVPQIPTRGYQLVQHASETVHGIGIDPDTTQTDAEGGTALWLKI
jgi:Domain of unknown function (DUF1906)